ncbi:MAG: DUF4212 domain-containing protein [Phycisphaerae bacterium]|nr:DUF4212 domain-containing protein [Phycisphaerae bacterium]
MTDAQGKDQQDPQSSGPSKYDVNFFRPKSPHARADMKLISVMLVIWLVAVFGFQFLLLYTCKATPEPAYKTFQKVWPSVVSGNADADAQKQFSRSVLSVLGKNIAVSDKDKVILKEALCYSVNSLLPADKKAVLANYNGGKADTKIVAASIGLADTGFDKLMIDLLPTSLKSENPAVLSDKSKVALPGIMELFLVHNRGPLTEAKFLGFPFHYWYTAQFLLILFVLLCLTYAILIDKINAKYGFTEK